MAPVGGNVIVNGNGAANTILSVTGANCIYNAAPCNITVQNIRLQTTTTGAGLRTLYFGAKITLGPGVIFGACAEADMWAQGGAIGGGGQAYTKTGNTPRHYFASSGGLIEMFNATITVTGTPAFSDGFAHATDRSGISAFGMTYSGAATGQRYISSLYSVVNTFGGGASYFPGNAAGTATTGAYA